MSADGAAAEGAGVAVARGGAVARLGLLGSLYFAQGLPFGFFTQALPAMLRKQGFSLTEIGLSSLLAVPWALKFVWAPLVDRFQLPGLGRRRSWILPLQALSTLTLVALGLSRALGTAALMAAVFALNLLCATQDIATDALAVDTLAPEERGLANGLQVAGYRVGMIVGGGALLMFNDQLGERGTFLAMAALMAAASLPILLAREPVATRRPSARSHFLRRPGAARLLVLIVSYKFGEAFATGMLRPFLADRGLTLADLGWLLGTVGFVAGLLGALAGGALVNRLGRRTALLAFGVLQAATVAGYAWLALSPRGGGWLTALCAAEHFTGGLATAALFTCMMDWSTGDSGATDYTVQASAVVIATGLAATVSGVSAQALGYAGHFSLAAALSLGALAAVAALFPKEAPCAPPSTPARSTP